MSQEPADLDRWFDGVRRLADVKQNRAELEFSILDVQERRIGRVYPLTVRHLGNEELVRTFVHWRNQARQGYLDRRTVTQQSTREWLEEVVTAPNRVSFLIEFQGRLIGRGGVVRATPRGHEADGLVRGERGGGFDFWTKAQAAYLAWTFRTLGGEWSQADIRASNWLALENSRRLGYSQTPVAIREIRPVDDDVDELRASVPESGTVSPTDLSLVMWTLRLAREDFFARFPAASTEPR